MSKIPVPQQNNRPFEVQSFYNLLADKAGVIDENGAIEPSSLSDANASNNRIYYSTTQSKLVYKDSSGIVHNLY